MSIPQIQTELIILDNFPDPTNYTSWEVYANDVHVFLTKMGVFTEKEIEFKIELNNIIKALNIDINTINENSVLMEQLKIEILQKVEEAKTSAENAKNSEIAAKISEQNAKQSEQNTKTSETNAKQSEELAKQYAQSSDARNALLKQNNLSDLENKEVARENLELSYAMQEEVNTGVVEDKVLSPKVLANSLLQTTGQDNKRAMSQKAITNAIENVSLKAGDIILTSNENYTYPQWADCNGNNVDFDVYPAIEDKLYKWSAQWEQLPDLNPPLAKALNSPIITWDGVYIIGWQSSPHTLIIYKNINNVYTSLANISMEAVPRHIKSSVNGDYIVATLQSAPWLAIFKRVGDSFIRLTIPVNFNDQIHSVSLTEDGMYLAVLTKATPYSYVYKRDGDVFAPLFRLLGTYSYYEGVIFSKNGKYLLHTTGSLAQPKLYKRDGDVFTEIRIRDLFGVDIHNAFAQVNNPLERFAFSLKGNHFMFICPPYDVVSLKPTYLYRIIDGIFVPLDTSSVIQTLSGPIIFTEDEQYVFIFNGTQIYKYKIVDNKLVFVEKIANSTIPQIQDRQVTTNYIFDKINGAPFIKIYKPSAVTLPDLTLSVDVPNTFKYKIKTGL